LALEVAGTDGSVGTLSFELLLRLALSNALRNDASDWARCP
jgi:hypothetical protein